jgi:hypothetical protein
MFDKQKFAEILIGIKGKRSINQFWKDTGVDAGYLSRLLRCQKDKPPSAEIINKFSSDSNVTEQLMIAAGYMPPIHVDSEEWLNELKAAPSDKKEAIQLIWKILKEL